MNLFTNMKVYLPNGAEGIALRLLSSLTSKGKIAGAFGKSGKFKVDFSEPQKDLAGQTIKFPVKRYVFDKTRQLRQ